MNTECSLTITKRNWKHEYQLDSTHERSSSNGVVVNALDYDIVVNEFELKSRYYFHLRKNTIWKSMEAHVATIMDQ